PPHRRCHRPHARPPQPRPPRLHQHRPALRPRRRRRTKSIHHRRLPRQRIRPVQPPFPPASHRRRPPTPRHHARAIRKSQRPLQKTPRSFSHRPIRQRLSKRILRQRHGKCPPPSLLTGGQGVRPLSRTKRIPRQICPAR